MYCKTYIVRRHKNNIILPYYSISMMMTVARIQILPHFGNRWHAIASLSLGSFLSSSLSLIMACQHFPTIQNANMVVFLSTRRNTIKTYQNLWGTLTTNPQLLSLLSRPYGGILIGGNMLGNHHHHHLIVIMIFHSSAIVNLQLHLRVWDHGFCCSAV